MSRASMSHASFLPATLLAVLAGAGAPAAAAVTGAPVDVRPGGDTLLIERSQRAAGVDLPRRGASMAEVEAKFGAPAQKHAPVGGGSRSTPPITRWTYAGFSVYFENSHVVNAVLNKSAPLEIGPAPVRP
jgi:hypothetical protein